MKTVFAILKFYLIIAKRFFRLCLGENVLNLLDTAIDKDRKSLHKCLSNKYLPRVSEIPSSTEWRAAKRGTKRRTSHTI